MAKIIGVTTTTPVRQPDWNQTDPNKADYIKNKPFEKVDDALNADSTNPVQNKVVAQALADLQPVRFTVTQQGKRYVSSKTFKELTDILAENEHRSIICEVDGYDVPLCLSWSVLPLNLTFATNLPLMGAIVVSIMDAEDYDDVKVEYQTPSIEINGQLWDADNPNADFTDTINSMISDAIDAVEGAVEVAQTAADNALEKANSSHELASEAGRLAASNSDIISIVNSRLVAAESAIDMDIKPRLDAVESAVNAAGSTASTAHSRITNVIEPRIEAVEKEVGEIDAALDELHAYAQALANGGATE